MSAPPKTTITAFRPYTSYNLFFQLERAYILQTLHGFRPTLAPADTFDPASAKSNYQGCPTLPPRYDGLVLPYDWHIPGKTVRRKRSHRKSHGKIGFHELNERISQAWSDADGEVREFCARLSDFEARKYKAVDKDRKKAEKRRKKEEAERRRKVDQNVVVKSKKEHDSAEDHDECYNPLVASFDWTIALPQRNVAPDGPSSHNFVRTISRDSFPELGAPPLVEVDMNDDEIMDLWKSIPVDDDAVVPHSYSSATCGVCMEIPETRRDGDDETRRSFINEEYERFKEIGIQFKRRSLPDGFKKKTFTASQA